MSVLRGTGTLTTPVSGTDFGNNADTGTDTDTDTGPGTGQYLSCVPMSDA